MCLLILFTTQSYKHNCCRLSPVKPKSMPLHILLMPRPLKFQFRASCMHGSNHGGKNARFIESITEMKVFLVVLISLGGWEGGRGKRVHSHPHLTPAYVPASSKSIIDNPSPPTQNISAMFSQAMIKIFIINMIN